jgi:hypothetical protein
MSVRHLAPALVLTLALTLAGQPAQAQGSHRGGGARGSHGVSAVARHPSGGARSGPAGGARFGSGPRYAPRGSVAERRHPRAGTGSGAYGYYYRPRHDGYYRPYYGGYDRPYSRPHFYGSLSFSWPYYSAWPYYSTWPYYLGGYSYDPGYDVGYYAPYPAGGRYSDDPSEARNRDADRSSDSDRDSGRIRLEVRPEDTSVYVDDAFRGTGREARALTLPPGRHAIELVRPGYATERREVEVVTGGSRDVLVEMQRR